MATMIPKDIDEFKTEGEKRFYRFLESVAKPDQKYTIWYLPDVEGREPDFILRGKRSLFPMVSGGGRSRSLSLTRTGDAVAPL